MKRRTIHIAQTSFLTPGMLIWIRMDDDKKLKPVVIKDLNNTYLQLVDVGNGKIFAVKGWFTALKQSNILYCPN